MKQNRPLILLFWGALVILLMGFVFPYFAKFLPSPSGIDSAKWQELGQRGDFFGGFMNPLFSFLAFMGVLYSLAVQRRDLDESRLDADRQQFENTFFQLLSVHNRIVEGLDVHVEYRKENSVKGRDCFVEYFSILQKCINESEQSFGPDALQKIQAGYKMYWQRARQDLGHYYRFMYNFIRYIDQAKLPRLDYDEVNPKIKYARILRAQLSDYELALIFYNALSDHGGKFKAYVEKYDMLDNLPEDLVPWNHLQYRDGMGQVGKIEQIGN